MDLGTSTQFEVDCSLRQGSEEAAGGWFSRLVDGPGS